MSQSALRLTGGALWMRAGGVARWVYRAFVPTPDAVEVRRSRRRTRTVTAWREGGVTVVSIPARFTRAQEREWVDKMLHRLAAQDERRRPSDTVLQQRAMELSRQYLGGRAVPASVSWSSRQGKRWGSCTTVDRTIRISDRLQGMPRWVLDYVLMHELAHLLHPGHDARFWAEVERYPHTERARGFLDGYAYAQGRGEAGRGDDEQWDDEQSDGDPAPDEVGVAAAEITAVPAEPDDGPAGVLFDIDGPRRPGRRAR
jgi:predicted metal-dependent hydrolase